MTDKNKKKLLLYVTLFCSTIYILWRMFFTLPITYGSIPIIVGTILVLCEALTILETFTHFINSSHVKKLELPVIADQDFPTVDMLICTHDEDTELIFKTLSGCLSLKYPDRSKVKIHLCDDTDRDSMRQLAAKMGVNYHGFKGNQYAKAGNLNYALKRTKAELVAVLDADMIPTSNFLLETVPYFDVTKEIRDGDQRHFRRTQENQQEKPVGFVQTRQSFYNLDTFQKNLFLEDRITNEQDYFYREVNPSRMASGSAAFAGSNVVFSRVSLEAANGFATHSITEDLATSIEIESRGYRGIALDKELAHGLCPEDTPSLIKQRKRWSYGSAQSIITNQFFQSKLPFRAKFNYFISYLYWWTFFRRFVFIICPILFSVFGIVIADTSLLSLLIMWLPYYIFYSYSMKIMSDHTINTTLSAIQDTIQFPHMIVPIFYGTLQIPNNKFEVTSKARVGGNNSDFKLTWPFIILIGLSIWGVYNSIIKIVIDHHEGSIIVLFWLLYNLLALFNAVVYYRGRRLNPQEEMLAIEQNIKLADGKLTWQGRTTQMNDYKICFLSDQVLTPGVTVNMTLDYRDYHVKLEGKPVLIDQQHNVYEMSVDLEEFEMPAKMHFYQILYDRDHTLNRVVNLGYWTDIKVLLTNLFRKRAH
ncbi:cellulose synthase catalytic subunit [Lactiplantibacillus sp. DA1]|uniref:glycosyltransferase family 2 protein n=1 Tax=Lactiplantibacillus sp. DA1 TaxID=3079857 RepID=UPI00292A6521|nr:cellulose synthase catalytic subunit [Lactiplantibacillus sp. DA1]MDV0431093.1 cellulose synthase catalytic subunit [Lactiplantibacillus sp. DA1]